MRTILCLAIFISSFSAFAAASRTSDALKTEIKEDEFVGVLKDGYHFNQKAPNGVVIDSRVIRPNRISEKEIQFSGLASFSNGKASLYICDDALTFCETQQIELKGKGGETKKGKVATAVSKNFGKVNKHGFIEDDFAKALAEAKKKKQPLLIDFSARWCPGCVRLETEMFGTAEFKKATKNFVKLKVDVDRFENGVLSEKYKIRGIPTLLVVNAAQEEIERIVDFQPIEILDPFFSTIAADPTSINELSAKAAEGGSPTLLRLGKRLLRAGRAEEAVAALKQVEPVPPELVAAQIKSFEQKFSADKNAKRDLVKALEKAVKNEPSSSRALTWRTTLASLYEKPDDKAQVRREGVAAADVMLADSEKLKQAVVTDLVGEYTGFEPLMIAMARAELIEVSAAPAPEIDDGWRKAAQIGLDLKIPSEKVGINMRHLIVLIQAQLFEDAEKLTARLLKVDPKNPELQRRRLRVLVEMKKFNEAIVLGRKVVKNSYGRNEFWAAELLAKAYIAANRNREAEVLVASYLARNEVEWPNMKDSRKNFEDMLGKIPKD